MGNIPHFEKISMKTPRPNKIHVTSIIDKWGFIDTSEQQTKNHSDIAIEETDTEIENIDDFSFLCAECSQILGFKTTTIQVAFLAGSYAMFQRSHPDKNEEELIPLFSIFVWDEAARKEKGIFNSIIKKELEKSQQKI
jgi:hypothetical protein